MREVACVTGSGSGIGLAVARSLAGNAYQVVVVDIREPGDATEVMNSLGGSGHVYVKADISSTAGRDRTVSEIRNRCGRLDLLVNNAGVAPRQRTDILEVSEESYDRVMGINLKGPFFLTQSLANYMIETGRDGICRRPKIVNISSISAYTSSTSRSEYCLSKAGMSMMTKLYADRLAEFGINVYEIRPGLIKTPMTEVVQAKYDEMIVEQGLLPIKRWGLPEDIAAAVVAIAGGSFDYSTGQVFDIDGGFHIRRL
ncbi:MAG: 3-ketoacyl-ACP reductase [Armatimonadetes bacterium RBG_16_58_9]|nr:MAG: 3-ketoacyl-ACP reductase [Armatimonadetes bacterium RBG_16_58_9]